MMLIRGVGRARGRGEATSQLLMREIREMRACFDAEDWLLLSYMWITALASGLSSKRRALS